MAGAGFYYEPTGSDRAICFQCGICLLYWEPTDEPWSEHERHATSCPYVMGRFTENVPLLISDATSHAQQHFSTQLISCWSSVYESNFWGTGSQDGVVTLWDLQHGFTPLRLLQVGQFDSNRVDKHRIGWLESKFFVEVTEQSSHPEVEFVITPPASPSIVPSPPPNLPGIPEDEPAVTPKIAPDKPAASADKSAETEVILDDASAGTDVKLVDTTAKPTEPTAKLPETENAAKPVDAETKKTEPTAKPPDTENAAKPIYTAAKPTEPTAKPSDTENAAKLVDTAAKPTEPTAKLPDTENAAKPVYTEPKTTEPTAKPSDTENAAKPVDTENSLDTDTKPASGDKPADPVEKPTLDKATLSADDSDDVTPVSTAPDTPLKQSSDSNAGVYQTGASLYPDTINSETDKQTGNSLL